MKHATRSIGLAAALCAANALAAGPAASDSVGELTLTGNQLLMLFGGAALLGVTIWLVIRLLSK